MIQGNDIIRHFTYVACCLHVSEDDCLPSKHMARVNGKEIYSLSEETFVVFVVIGHNMMP
jgi:hypothetical protein